MEMAINYEMERQAKLLDQGQTPKQETRGFSAESGKTFSQRAKEEAEDYRYFPDPDLPPIEFEPAEIAQIKQELVELPDQYAARLSEEHQLSLDLAQRLVKNKKRAEFFEQLLILAKREKIESKKIINTLLNKKIDYHLSDDPKNTIEEYKKLNELEEMSPEIITELIKELLQENQDVVEKYQSGKTEVLAFLIGQSMKKIAKKVDVNLVKKVLLDQLNN